MKVPKYIIEKMSKANEKISEGNSLILNVTHYLMEKGATSETIEYIQRELDTPYNDNCVERILNELKGE